MGLRAVKCISIHALREEGDGSDLHQSTLVGLFLSTPSARRATAAHAKKARTRKFLSTPSARRATEHIADIDFQVVISIHALREEGDSRKQGKTPLKSYFYPRPPRGGRLSLSGVTFVHFDFYPRPPRGGRLRTSQPTAAARSFLSTPSARRATCGSSPAMDGPLVFLSTPSARRATRFCWRPGAGPWHFYPRPPRGGRLKVIGRIFDGMKFLSTPSARRATAVCSAALAGGKISIHALREEGDSMAAISGRKRANFYPRPPRGGRQQKQRQNLYFQTNYTTFCTNLEEP